MVVVVVLVLGASGLFITVVQQKAELTRTDFAHMRDRLEQGHGHG